MPMSRHGKIEKIIPMRLQIMPATAIPGVPPPCCWPYEAGGGGGA
jgi:hypothetical protein